MRLPKLLSALLALCLLSCGGGKPSSSVSCQHDKDCPAGQGCLAQVCEVLPCGGCQPEEACGADGKCVLAQGATCADHTCPASYPCHGTICSKACTLNADCDSGFICNSQLKGCAECANNDQCAGKAGRTRCDADNGVCAACNVNIDCGSGHYCDAHACKPGCKSTNDCNAGLGETCDLTSTPGKCIQCRTKADCQPFGSTQSACDDTNHCVQCYGATQNEANNSCDSQHPECDLRIKQCVACLPANNESGKDCGYPNAGARDPHYATTCDPATNSCRDGCAGDAQCGCPRTAPGGAESSCARLPGQEHCDPNRTTMAGAPGTTLGACVECFKNNTHCAYRKKGSTQYGGAYATLNGARCDPNLDSCIEGCDADADCPSGRICHLAGSNDPNSHKCVECTCDNPSSDGAFCLTTLAGPAACANDAQGRTRVCDSASLLCRLKREGEACGSSTECGDRTDPATADGCLASSSYGSQAGTARGFCAASYSPTIGPAVTCTPGRCAVFCSDLQQNLCFAGSPGVACPAGTHCRQATEVGGDPNKVCVQDNRCGP